MYQISGSYQLPDDFTLAAKAGGGFDIVNTAGDSTPLLMLGDRSVVDNVTFTASEAPDTGYEGANAKLGTDFDAKRAIGIFGADNVTIVNSSFSGNISFHLDVRSSDNLVVQNTYFEGAYEQIRLLGDTNDARIVESHFESSLGDGIKSERGGEYGPQGTQVQDCLFANNLRDGIDTAGGFKDALVSNSVFYNNGVSAMDIKTLLEKPTDLSPNVANSGIRVEDCQIIDSRNGIVVTMLDRMGVLTKANADQLMPQDIVVSNTTFENTGTNTTEMRAFLIKDGHSITWNNLTFLGPIDELRLMNAEAPSGWTAHDIGGTVTTQGPSDGVDDLWQHQTGPLDDGPAGTSRAALAHCG